MIINNQTYGDVWQSCLSRIREHTSDEEFAKWFKPIVPLDFDGVTLKLKVPNESYVYHIEKHISFSGSRPSCDTPCPRRSRPPSRSWAMPI